MFRTPKPSRIVIFLLTIALLVSVFQLTHASRQDQAAAQGSLSTDGPAKAPLGAAPQTLLPYDTFFATQGLVFVPVSSSMTSHGGQAGCRSSDVPGDYFASVNIPHGSVVDTLEVVFYNPSALSAQHSYLGLMQGSDSGTWSGVVYKDFANLSQGYHIESIAASGHVINTYIGSYTFMWHSNGADTQLCQARLYYRPPIWMASYLPSVRK